MMLEALKFVRCNDVYRIKMLLTQTLVCWYISVAFEVAPEEVNIDNLTDIEKKNPIEIIQARGEVLLSRY